MNTILIYVVLSSLLGFAFSTYVYKQTNRESLEHKAMIILDGVFVVCALYGSLSLYYGVDIVIPKGLVLGMLIPLDLYVGVVAVHHRTHRIDSIGSDERRKEELKGKDYDVGNC